MELFLVRHGDPEHVDDPIALHGDVDLSPLGVEQARAAGRALAPVPIVAVLASPLVRAIHTGAILAEPHSAPIEAWPTLAETNRKGWKLEKSKRSWNGRTGLTAREVRARYPDVHPVGFEGDERWWEKVATEGRGKAYRRAMKAIDKMRGRWARCDDAIAVVTHGAFGSVLLAVLLESASTDYCRYALDYCGITHLTVSRKRAILRTANRVEHLVGVA